LNRSKKYTAQFFCFIGVILAAQVIYFYYIQSSNPVLKKTDIIAILPAAEDRIKAGYELGKSGYAPNIAIIGVSADEQKADDRRYRGFPSNVRRIFTDESWSTFEDALNIRNIVKKHNFQSITLVTSSYHMPRAYFLLQILLAGSDIKVQRCGTTKDHAASSNWTHAFADGRTVLIEMIKFWGSCFEMLTHKITGDLMSNNP